MSQFQIGITLIENNLHFCLVNKKQHSWRLLESHTYRLDSSNDLFQVLRILRKQIPRRNRRIVLGLPYHRVLMKEIRIASALQDHEIYCYLQNQANSLFGKSAKPWFIDYEFCHSITTSASQRQIRAVAASSEEVLQLTQVFNSSNLDLHIIDVDVLALSRLMPCFDFYNPELAQGLVWIKTAELIFLVAQAGNLIFTKRSLYKTDQNLHEILTPLMQFYHGLFPENTIEIIFLINANSDGLFTTGIAHPLLRIARINSAFHNQDSDIDAQDFCSLGLAIYEY